MGNIEIDVGNPKEVLANMQEELCRYEKAAKKKRGMTPYISMFCADMNKFDFQVTDIIKVPFSQDCDRDIKVMIKYKEGLPGYSSAGNHSPQELHEALWEAEAEAWNNHQDFKSKPTEECEKRLLHDTIIKDYVKLENFGIKSFSEINKEEIYEFLTKINNRIWRTSKGIIGASASMNLLAGNEIFYDSRKTEIIQEISRVLCDIAAYARAEDAPKFRKISINRRSSGFCGAELINSDSWLFKESLNKAEDAAKTVVKFAKAKNKEDNFELKATEYDAVIDGEIACGLIHEIGSGHAAEASQLIKEDYDKEDPFEGMMGEKVGIKDLNIIDFGPLIINGKKPFSWYKYDVEGVKARKTYIVKEGCFNSYLHTKLTAGSLPEEKIGSRVLTGNARLGDIEENTPESRMSSLYLEPSKKRCSLEDLLDSIKGKGIYVKGAFFGQTNTAQGEVTVQEVYFVNKKMELIPLRIKKHDIIFVGDVVSYMNKIEAIGDKSTVNDIGNGWCGSESGWVPQSNSGAAIKVKGIGISPRELTDLLKKPLVPVPRRKYRQKVI